VLEKGAIELGDVGRNTAIMRSNCLLPENGVFCQGALDIGETPEHGLMMPDA